MVSEFLYALIGSSLDDVCWNLGAPGAFACGRFIIEGVEGERAFPELAGMLEGTQLALHGCEYPSEVLLDALS